jgi:hypothetical protein
VCGNSKVARAVMSPRIGKKGKTAEAADVPAAPSPRSCADAEQQQMAALTRKMPKELREALLKVRAEVEKNCEHVGDKFADEARKIHYGESDKRGIYGETTDDEAEALGRGGHRVRPPALDSPRELGFPPLVRPSVAILAFGRLQVEQVAGEDQAAPSAVSRSTRSP